MTNDRPQAGPSQIDWPAVRARLERALAATGHSARTPAEEQRILGERARNLAIPPVQAAPAAVVAALTFTLGGEPWAIETLHVAEIVRPDDLAAVPGAAAVLLGLIPVRGEILAVFDLRRLFDLPLVARAEDRAARVIVLGGSVAELGLIVDSVGELRLIDTAGLGEPPETLSAVARRLVRGVTPDGRVLLDGTALLEDEHFTLAQNAEA